MLPHLRGGHGGLLGAVARVGHDSRLLSSVRLLRSSIQSHGRAPTGTTWLGMTLCRLRGMAALECRATEVLRQRKSSTGGRTGRVERVSGSH